MNGYTVGVAANGDYLYITDAWDEGGGHILLGSLRVLSISDPENPVEVGNCSIDYHAEGVTISSGYAYVANGYEGLLVVSVSQPWNPMVVGQYYFSEGALYDVAVYDGYAYVAHSYAGMVILDYYGPPSIGANEFRDRYHIEIFP